MCPSLPSLNISWRFPAWSKLRTSAHPCPYWNVLGSLKISLRLHSCSEPWIYFIARCASPSCDTHLFAMIRFVCAFCDVTRILVSGYTAYFQFFNWSHPKESMGRQQQHLFPSFCKPFSSGAAVPIRFSEWNLLYERVNQFVTEICSVCAVQIGQPAWVLHQGILSTVHSDYWKLAWISIQVVAI